MVWNMFGSKPDYHADCSLTRRDWTGLALPILASFLTRPSVAQTCDVPDTFFQQLKTLDGLPTGPESTDNFITNEDSIASVLDQLTQEVPPNSVYLGVGPDQNYSMMAAVNPSFGLILDFRKKNQLLHFLHKILICESPDRISYLESLWARESGLSEIGGEIELAEILQKFQMIPMQPELLQKCRQNVSSTLKQWNYLQPEEIEETLRIESRIAGPGPSFQFLALKFYPQFQQLMQMKTRRGEPGHWLASPSFYEKIRRLHVQDRILPIVADWSERPKSRATGSFQKISDWMRSQNLKVGCVYLSDVEFFLMRNQSFADYLQNLSCLPIDDKAHIIRTSTKQIAHPERVSGLSSTTIVRPLKRFLTEATKGRYQDWQELFS